MSFSVASCLSASESIQRWTGKNKASKNPGLSLNLAPSASEKRPITDVSSTTSSSEDGAQYVLIPAESPFYKHSTPANSSAYFSFTGFAFACGALADEDPLFSKSPSELLDEDLQALSPCGDLDTNVAENATADTSASSPAARQRRRKHVMASKNPGLSVNIRRDVFNPRLNSSMRPRPLTADSLSNTPTLEPSSDTDGDSENEGSDADEGAQIVYISANSPFNRSAFTTSRTSSHLSFSAFPFACDALTEEDPLFSKSPSELFDNELRRAVPGSDDGVIVVDSESLAEMDSQLSIDWDSVKNVAPAKPNQMMPTSVVYGNETNALQPYF